MNIFKKREINRHRSDGDNGGDRGGEGGGMEEGGLDRM